MRFSRVDFRPNRTHAFIRPCCRNAHVFRSALVQTAIGKIQNERVGFKNHTRDAIGSENYEKRRVLRSRVDDKKNPKTSRLIEQGRASFLFFSREKRLN